MFILPSCYLSKMFATYLCGYLIVYAAAKYPPKLWPNKIIFSISIFSLHSSIDSTNWVSASAESLLKCGLLLWPNPTRSKAQTVRCRLRASKFKDHSPTPPPNPCIRTSGVLFGVSWLNINVHILLPLGTKTYAFVKLLWTPAKYKGYTNQSDLLI